MDSLLPYFTVAPLAFGLTVRSNKIRYIAILMGALIAFQSSDSIAAPKLAYLGLLVLTFIIAFRHRHGPLLRATTGAALLLGALSVLAYAKGNDPIWIFRDITSYVMLLSAGILAQHFGAILPEMFARRVAIGVSVFAAYIMTARWVTLRGFGHLPTFGNPSFALFTLAVSLSAASALEGRHSFRWWTMVGVLWTGAVLTGTRSMLLTLLPAIAIAARAFLRRRGTRTNASRALVTGLAAVPLALVSVLSLASWRGINLTAAVGRVSTVFSLGENNASDSLNERKIQNRLALSAFNRDPFTGSGPGTIWQVTRPSSRTTYTSISIDTALAVLAKWGMFGTFSLLLLLHSWWRLCRPTKVESFWGVTSLGFAMGFAPANLLGAATEEKGLPVALIILGTGTLAYRRQEIHRKKMSDSEIRAKDDEHPGLEGARGHLANEQT